MKSVERNHVHDALAEVQKRLATLATDNDPNLRAAVNELLAAADALKTCAEKLDDALRCVGSAYAKFERLAATAALQKATKYDA